MRLQQLRKRLADLSLLNLAKIPRDRAGYGSRVTLLDTEKGDEIGYQLVTAEESDVARGLISTPSPIGRALLGRKPGDVVRVQTPEGLIVAKPMPKPGWQVELKEGDYAKSYDYYGTPVTKGVKEIAWTGGNLPDNFYDEFVFRVRVTGFEPGTRIHLPVVQECGSAAERWIEIPEAGKSEDDYEHPAPGFTVTKRYRPFASVIVVPRARGPAKTETSARRIGSPVSARTTCPRMVAEPFSGPSSRGDGGSPVRTHDAATCQAT